MGNCNQSLVIRKLPTNITSSNITDFNDAVNNSLINSVLHSGSANWDSVYSTVSGLSAIWSAANESGLVNLEVQSNSACWSFGCESGMIFAANSGLFLSTTNTVETLSTSWGKGDTSVNNFVYSNSANIVEINNLFNVNSGNYDSVFTTVNANSSTWGLSGGSPADTGNIRFNGSQITSTDPHITVLATDPSGYVNMAFEGGSVANYMSVAADGASIQTNGNGVNNLWQFTSDGTTNFPTSANGVAIQFDIYGNAVFNGTIQAASLCATTFHVGASTIFFMDASGNAITKLDFSDILLYNSTYNTLNTLSSSIIGSGLTVNSTTILSGVSGNLLINNNGVLAEIGASVGGNATLDTGKVIKFGTGGSITGSGLFSVDSHFPNRYGSLTDNGIYWADILGSSNIKFLLVGDTTSTRTLYLPDSDGILISTGDNSVITNDMLISGDIFQSTYSTVNANSASNWNYQGNDVRALTANYSSVYSTVNSNSANNNSNYTTVNVNSANWNISFNQVNILASYSANNNSVYTNVNTNSALNWNYQGNDVRALTANYSSVYSTVNSNSANWNISFNQSNILASSSANNGSVYTTLNSNSANYSSVYSIVNSNSASNWNYQGTDIKALTANYESVYSNVNSNSASDIDTRNTVQTNSATWGTGSGGTGDVNVNNFVYTNSALLLSTDVIYRANSANYGSVYTNVNTNSALNWNYQGNDVRALTANYSSNYTTVNSNSATWGSGGGGTTSPIPLIAAIWS